jgi:hypothetical protein
MSTVDWVISSRAWTDETPTWNATPEAVTAPLGSLYLIHDTPDLDLLARVVVAMAAAGIVAPAAFVTEDRHVRLTSSGVFSVTWNAATTLRDLLGFTGDLAAASGYTAPLRSPLLWSPGKIFTPGLAPLNAHGKPIADISVTFGTQGSAVARQEGAPTEIQRFIARHVDIERWYEAPPNRVPGEYAAFWETEIMPLNKLVVLRDVVEGLSSTATATYPVGEQLGPYFPDLSKAEMRTRPMTRSAGFGLVEKRYDVTLSLIVTAEFT